MFNVLITGSKGFLGVNLKNALPKQNVIIHEFTRHDSRDILKQLIDKTDFIYHFAGEVRPKSSDEAFRLSHVDATETLIETIEKSHKKIPILMASSIHAAYPKNVYGRTKREAELLIEAYSKRNNVATWIYRLPHIFGEGCKPNYNSVISTWIYNSIHDLEIIVFDRDIEMHYSYVKDIMKEFIDHLYFEGESNAFYSEPQVIYDTTLGEVIDQITNFKENINNPIYKITGNDFKKKLFITYQDYMEKR